jgi:hypothetical protein
LLGWDKPRLHTASLVVDPDRVAVILVRRVRLQRKARAGSEVVRLDRLEPVAGARDLHDVYAMAGEGFVIPRERAVVLVSERIAVAVERVAALGLRVIGVFFEMDTERRERLRRARAEVVEEADCDSSLDLARTAI